MRIAALVLSILLAHPSLAEEVATIHVVPGSHLDIGFTDTPDGVKAKRIRVLDDAIAAAQADPEFRWFEESAWTIDAWREAHKDDPKSLDAFKALLKEGRISASASWCSPHAAMFADHLDLLFFHLDRFERDYGVRPVAAVLNDVPMFPQALVDACAAAGVKFLLVGANTAFSPPLPREIERTPFWWESPSGKRVLVWVDDDAYPAAYMKWGFDPDTARFFAPKEFDPKVGALETMEKGISRMVRSLASPRGAAIVQHAFDNWDTGPAKKLPGFAKQWNDSKKGPRISLGGPEAFFRDIEERCGKDLPVKRGEWGGAWDAIRACNPVWTWRLRAAMKKMPADAPYATRALLATAIEHSQGLGPGWGGMLTEAQTLAHNDQVAGLFRRAVTAVDPKLADAVPPPIEMPKCEGEPEAWKAVLTRPRARFRAGKQWLGPFVVDSAPEIRTELVYCTDQTVYTIRSSFDRAALGVGDGAAVIEIPLRAAAKDVTLAPADSPDACEGKWLRGEAPSFVVAPIGLRVNGLAHALKVTSDLVFSWCVVKDKDDAKSCWLQGLVARQSRQCEFKDKTEKVLDFEKLYVGEPQKLEIHVRVEIVE
ncbi:MAG: hypothetical protein FD180_1650 [Planctomycetota bacterium]|nr:MAG: hypothetical protein FD180_1650 [Planctomycetota bacterium]